MTARLVGAVGLGAFALGYGAWLLLAAVHRSLVTDPMAIEGDTRTADRTTSIGSGFGAELVLGLLASAVAALLGLLLLAIGRSTFATGLLAVAPWLPFLVVQDYWRWVGFMDSRPGRALANDAVETVAIAGALLAVAGSGYSHSPAAVITAWGAGAAPAALFGLYQFRSLPRLGLGLVRFKQRWAMSRWLLANSVTNWGAGWAYLLMAGAVLGPAALGGLKAAQTLVTGPSFVLIQAGGSIGLPESSRAFAKDGWAGLRRVTKLVSLVGLTALGLYGAVVIADGRQLLRWIYGPQFTHLAATASVIAVTYIVYAFGLGPTLSLKATRRTRSLFFTEMASLAVSAGFVLLLTNLYGVVGAAVSGLAAAVVNVGALLWFERVARRAVTGESRSRRERRSDVSRPASFLSIPRGKDRAAPLMKSESFPAQQTSSSSRVGIGGERVDTRRVMRALRKRRRLIGVAGLVGIGAGLGVGALRGPRYSANALVLVPVSTQQSSGQAMPDLQTQAAIAQSQPVLAQAGRAVSPAVPATTLVHEVTVSSVAPQVLSVSVTARDSSQAKRLADAVATAFIGDTTDPSSSSSSDGMTNRLQQDATALNKQLSGVQQRISAVASRLATETANSQQARADSTLLDTLRAEQSDATLQLNAINAQLTQVQLSGALAASGTRLLQNASTTTSDLASSLAWRGVVGGLAGVVGSTGLVLAGSLRDRRPRSRDRIAAAAGAPVVASLGAVSPRSSRNWAELLDASSATPADSLKIKEMLVHLRPSKRHPAALAVVSLAGDRAALAAGAQIAAHASSLGTDTALVLFSGGPGLAPLRSLLDGRGEAEFRSGTLHLREPPPDGGAKPCKSVLTIYLVTHNTASPRWPAGTTLLAVSPGAAEEHQLGGVALACSAMGRTLNGVIVTGADTDDHTLGRWVAPDPPLRDVGEAT